MPGALPRPLRRLLAARIFGATLLTVLGARIIADAFDDSFLGPPDLLVAPGNLYALAALLAALVIGLGILAGRQRALPLGLVLLSCNIGVAVPLVSYDVQVGGVLILWNILLLGGHLFGISSHHARGRRAAERDDSLAWRQRYGAAAQHLLMVSLFAGVAALGYPIRHDPVPRLAALGLALGSLALAAPFAYQFVRSRRRYVIALALVAAVWLPGAFVSSAAALGRLWVLQAGVLLAGTRGDVWAARDRAAGRHARSVG